MEQMLNSEQNAELTTSAPTCHNTMLVAATSFVSDTSNSQPKKKTVNADQIVWLSNILKHLVLSAKNLDSMPKNGLERVISDAGINAMIDTSVKTIIENVLI